MKKASKTSESNTSEFNLPVIFASLMVIVVCAPDISANNNAETSGKVTSIEAQCEEMAAGLRELSKSLPIQIDETTSMVAISADMDDGNCHISNVYQVNEDKLVSQFTEVSEGNLNSNQALAYLGSEPGREFVSSAIRSQSKAIYKHIGLTDEGMTVRMTYHFDKGSVDPIVINF